MDAINVTIASWAGDKKWACSGCKKMFDSKKNVLDHAITCSKATSTKPMRFDKYIGYAIYNCLNFSGRSSRTEYWSFALFAFTIYWLTGALDDALFIKEIEIDWSETGRSYVITTEHSAHGIIRFIGAVLLFLPSLALGVRRLHDINYSGWVIVIPIIGQILSFLLAFVASEDQINQYGEVPTNTIRRIGISKKI